MAFGLTAMKISTSLLRQFCISSESFTLNMQTIAAHYQNACPVLGAGHVSRTQVIVNGIRDFTTSRVSEDMGDSSRSSSFSGKRILSGA
jgi:hypothetical protein